MNKLAITYILPKGFGNKQFIRHDRIWPEVTCESLLRRQHSSGQVYNRVKQLDFQG